MTADQEGQEPRQNPNPTQVAPVWVWLCVVLAVLVVFYFAILFCSVSLRASNFMCAIRILSLEISCAVRRLRCVASDLPVGLPLRTSGASGIGASSSKIGHCFILWGYKI